MEKSFFHTKQKAIILQTLNQCRQYVRSEVEERISTKRDPRAQLTEMKYLVELLCTVEIQQCFLSYFET